MQKLVAAGLAGGRLAIGAAIWLAPDLGLRALGFEGQLHERGLALARLAGTRDLVIGAWMASAIDAPERLRPAAAASAACDGGDMLAFLLLSGSNRRAAVIGSLAASSATVAGVWLWRSLADPA